MSYGDFKKAHLSEFASDLKEESPRQAALRYILEAWDEAAFNGIDTECLAHAALFSALCELVEIYGEDQASKITNGLAERIQHGEFTINRVEQ